MKLRILLSTLCMAPVMAFAQQTADCSQTQLRDTDMPEVTSSVARQPNDIERMELAKRISYSHCMTVIQITQICRLLTEESHRLEYAKFAFDHTLDRENFSKVATALRSAKGKQALTEYTTAAH